MSSSSSQIPWAFKFIFSHIFSNQRGERRLTNLRLLSSKWKMSWAMTVCSFQYPKLAKESTLLWHGMASKFMAYQMREVRKPNVSLTHKFCFIPFLPSSLGAFLLFLPSFSLHSLPLRTRLQLIPDEEKWRMWIYYILHTHTHTHTSLNLDDIHIFHLHSTVRE